MQYHDSACVELFRKGAPLVGRLPRAANGEEVPANHTVDVKGLKRDAVINNERVIRKLREDEHAQQLHEAGICAPSRGV